MTDFSSIASCPILCTKRSSFRDVLSISLQGRRILLRLFSGLILSQHLGRWNWQRFGASPKIISRERSTPVCCPNYKTNSKGAFFWENPKTDLWSHADHTDSSIPPKNGRSEKGSFTMTTACPRTPRGKKTNKLIFTAKTRRKRNRSYEWIYEIDIFWFETRTFLE